MSETVLIGLLSVAGTVVGSLAGIVVANKLTNWRIQKLEEKVDKHNTIIERTYILEGQMKEVQHEIVDLKREE